MLLHKVWEHISIYWQRLKVGYFVNYIVASRFFILRLSGGIDKKTFCFFYDRRTSRNKWVVALARKSVNGRTIAQKRSLTKDRENRQKDNRWWTHIYWSRAHTHTYIDSYNTYTHKKYQTHNLTHTLSPLHLNTTIMLHAHANYAIDRDVDMGRRKYIHPQLYSGYTQTHTKTQKHKKPSNTCKTILLHRTLRCSTQESKMTFDILLSPPKSFCIISLAPVLFCISIINEETKERKRKKANKINYKQSSL